MTNSFKYITTLALCLTLVTGFALPTSFPKLNNNFSEKLVYGGNISAQFGTITFIDLSPNVGYRVTDRYIPGISLRYQYYNDKAFDINWNFYGGSIFNRYIISQSIFAQAEYETLNVPYFDGITLEEKRHWVGSMMLGGGLIYPFGSEINRSYFSISAMYIVNYDSNTSPYASPLIFRAGFVL